MAGEPEQRRQRDTFPAELWRGASLNQGVQMAGAAVALEGYRLAAPTTKLVP